MTTMRVLELVAFPASGSGSGGGGGSDSGGGGGDIYPDLNDFF